MNTRCGTGERITERSMTMQSDFDFTTVYDRHGKDAWAVDAIGTGSGAPGQPADGFRVIPMWVADMGFATAPCVTDAIKARLDHPLFGYFPPREEYYDAIIRWQRQQNAVEGLTAREIGYENGVLGGVVSAVNVLCSRGDNILIHSPTYIGFTHSLENNGYHLIHSPLVKDEDGVYRMDLEDMDRRIVQHHIHAAVFCSPHNPCGRVWTSDELRKMMELFERHRVTVISDEIWSDLILPGHRHIPTQSISDYARNHTIALYAPTKTFNLAGLIGSYHIIYDPLLRDRMRKEASLSHYNSMNVLSMHALTGAYREEGKEWLSGLIAVLNRNLDYAVEYMTGHFPGVQVSKPEGTYMLFADCGGWLRSHGKTMDELLDLLWNVGVAVQDGRDFGGAAHLRMNLALPFPLVQEAFDRMDKHVFNA